MATFALYSKCLFFLAIPVAAYLSAGSVGRRLRKAVRR